MHQQPHTLIEIANRLITLAGERTRLDDLALPPLGLAQLRRAVDQIEATTAANIETAIVQAEAV